VIHPQSKWFRAAAAFPLVISRSPPAAYGVGAFLFAVRTRPEEIVPFYFPVLGVNRMWARLSRMAPVNRLAGVALAVATLALAGCGTKGNVKGKVYYKDKPLPSGLVTFVANNKTLGTGTIQSDGSYEVKNVKAGEVTICVSAGMPTLDKSGRASAVVQIPPGYADPAKSNKKYTVTAGDQEYDIKLD